MNNVPSFFLPPLLPSPSPPPLFPPFPPLFLFLLYIFFSPPFLFLVFPPFPIPSPLLSLLPFQTLGTFLSWKGTARKRAKCPGPEPLPAPLQAGSQEQLCGSQEQLLGA